MGGWCVDPVFAVFAVLAVLGRGAERRDRFALDNCF
jgi:hypothetical protein